MDSNRLYASRQHLNRQGRAAPIIVLLSLAIAGAGYGGYRYVESQAESVSDQPLTYVVESGPFDHIVLEQGEIESSSNIDVVCEVKSRGSGGTPILWVIEEGTYVKEGDKLVELDSSSLESELQAQRIAVSSAEALVISSKATVRTAEIALEEYLKGTYLSERKAILSEIAVAEQELRKAELKLESTRRLAAKGVLKGLQIEAEQFSVANAKNILEAAQARLEVLDKLTKERNKVQFESDIEAAKARLKSDQSVLVEEMEKLSEIEDQIKKCVMYSPSEGVVVHNNEFSSRGGAEFVVEEGANVRERQTIIKLPDPTKMQVKAKVNESRITLIANGMAAKVKVSAVPDEMLAQVIRVNKYAEPGSWFTSSVKEYATFIEIVNPPEAIRTGMTAEVRIFVAQLEDALQVPVHGVYEYRGRHFCLRQTGDEQWETVPVEIGATNEKMVTIEKGLKKDDVIGLDPRKHLELMELPDIEDTNDRDALRKLGEGAERPQGVDGPGGRGPAAGGPGGRGGPPGGPKGAAGGQRGGPGGGGFDPSKIVEQSFQKYDSNNDGKIDSTEMANVPSPYGDMMKKNDQDGDGAVSKDEMLKAMKSRSR